MEKTRTILFLSPSTLQLLRIPFSFYLMPVFWFALGFTEHINIGATILCFILIHLFLYPSSNGYNSYMDRDETSIGGVEFPLTPTKQLFWVTILLDVTGFIISFFISGYFAIGFLIYLIFSRLYSYRGIRLKKYPVIGYLTVIINQGALIFIMVYLAASGSLANIPLLPIITATFLIGGFYPITQIYQHENDRKDGITTISMLLGKKGTIIFCGIMNSVALLLLFISYNHANRVIGFFIGLLFFIPVFILFSYWVKDIWKDESAANFKNTMRLNKVAAICTNLAFILIFIIYYFD